MVFSYQQTVVSMLTGKMRDWIFAFCLLPFAFCFEVIAQPAGVRPPVLKDVGVDQLLDHQVPLDLEFKDHTGRAVKLQDYANDKPIILSLVYYDCPQLCSLTLNGLMNVLKTLPMKAGKDFISLTVSFDPKETPELAAEKRNAYMQKLANPELNDGWHFLTGDEKNTLALTKSVGFRFVWDPVSKQYAHTSALIVITPQGKISRYFYPGDVLSNFEPRDIRFGVLDAAGGKIGSLADQVILYCYQYDPNRGTYGLVLMRIMRIFAVITIVTLIALILFLRHKTKQKEAAWAARVS
ncbi:MAG: SCO family protein [Acidobacteriota bacterium]|nr:SCO family protein [Acidobacteriota bacterium]